ncbi:perlucin-like protein [Ruditapes philippinarum]|uniref:perlucin-like protein n=1 Tax=Ruditapes philippinarum TaxID=129788 RepID=UPI00295BD1D8|nr:perlucin-like protein [Ruditapes philippinarum]
MANNGVLLYLLIAIALGQVYSDCPKGWIHHDESCYLFNPKDKYNWIESQLLCAGHQAYLVHVGDNAENIFVKGLISQGLGGVSGASVWMGASDDVVEGQFLWYGTDEPVTFTDWGPGEPNSIPLHLDEDCLTYWGDWNWKWADYDCHQQCNYVCEKPMDDGNMIVG